MLVIREAQMHVLGKRRQAEFQQRMVDTLVENYPRECRQAGGRSQIGVLVQQGVEAAAARGFRSRREVTLYVTLLMILEAGFAEDPQLPWVADWLDETVIADPTIRIENLFAETISYLDATAGEDSELVVRAMLRMRAFDLALVPTTEGEAWVNDVLAISQRFYPQKFEFQGEAATRNMVQEGVRRAVSFGLDDRIGVFVFLQCMFVLGSSFDRDTLQPWASAVLNDSNIVTGSARAERLYAEALSHLAQSLENAEIE